MKETANLRPNSRLIFDSVEQSLGLPFALLLLRRTEGIFRSNTLSGGLYVTLLDRRVSG